MSTDEVWAQIPGQPNYECSSIGRVRSTEMVVHRRHTSPFTKPGRVLTTGLCSRTGYLKIKLGYKGKTLAVHRLVATTFLSGSGACVNHKDGNKQNNRRENLEWATYSENNTHAYRALGRNPSRLGASGSRHKLSVAVIATCLATGEETSYESMGLARVDGYSHSKISNCIAGLRKSHGGMKWRLRG